MYNTMRVIFLEFLSLENFKMDIGKGQLRQEIVGKLAKGVKIESILGEICNKVGGGIFRDLMDCKGIIYIKIN